MTNTSADDFSFETYSDYQQAFNRCLLSSQRVIQLLDTDLSQTFIDDSMLIEHLQQSCLQSSYTPFMRILLTDTRFLQKNCPRLIQLLEYFSHKIFLRKIQSRALNDHPLYLIVDGEHMVQRFHPTLPTGKICQHNRSEITRWQSDFEPLWQCGERISVGKSLGL